MHPQIDERGLPSHPEAERLILASVMLGSGRFEEIAAVLQPNDFCLEPHRRIWAAMGHLYTGGNGIDRVTLVNYLNGNGQLESVGGVSYVAFLDDGMPALSNLDAYVSIVRDKAVLRRLILTAQGLIDRCLLASENPGALITETERTLASMGAGLEKHGDWLNPGMVITQAPGGLQSIINPVAGGVGISTGWRSLDALTCGLHRGDLFILAGRPSMGKSVVGMQVAHFAASKGTASAFISLEMSKESLIQRTIAAVARLDSHKMRAGMLSALERDQARWAANQIQDLPLWIDDTRARTSPAVTNALRKLQAKGDVGLLVVDHLQLMRSTNKSEKRNYELEQIVGDLKHLAGDAKICVMLLSQLNRECEIENRRPQLSDLKDSGSIEQDADAVMFVHRPERYAKNRDRADLRGVAEFAVAKQRNGPIGSINMVFLAQIQKFEEAYSGTSNDN